MLQEYNGEHVYLTHNIEVYTVILHLLPNLIMASVPMKLN